MAATNHERVGKALELLKAGLGPFVDRETQRAIKAQKVGAAALRPFVDDPQIGDRRVSEWDVAALLKLMWETWNEVFRPILGPAERGFVGEMRGHRNRWAHQELFSSDDAYRALDTTGRLLTAVSAPQAAEVDKLKLELLRVRFDEQARGERRKQVGLAIGSAAETLKPWRQVVAPHPDVASGRYQQAEFAADLWQVYLHDHPALRAGARGDARAPFWSCSASTTRITATPDPRLRRQARPSSKREGPRRGSTATARCRPMMRCRDRDSIFPSAGIREARGCLAEYRRAE